MKREGRVRPGVDDCRHLRSRQAVSLDRVGQRERDRGRRWRRWRRWQRISREVVLAGDGPGVRRRDRPGVVKNTRTIDAHVERARDRCPSCEVADRPNKMTRPVTRGGDGTAHVLVRLERRVVGEPDTEGDVVRGVVTGVRDRQREADDSVVISVARPTHVCPDRPGRYSRIRSEGAGDSTRTDAGHQYPDDTSQMEHADTVGRRPQLVQDEAAATTGECSSFGA